MAKVLITPAPLAGLDGLHVKALRAAGLEAVYPPRQRQLTEEELLEQLHGIEAALAGSEPYSRRILQANPRLRVIARAGVGFDAVDLSAATELGVAVAIAPGTNQDSVAEHTLALILALAKNLIAQHTGTRAGQWPRQANLPLRGWTLGIVGLGRIGKAVAVRASAFNMRLLAFEPFPDHAFARQYKVELVPWERILAESDFLSLHVPLSSESRYLIDRNAVAKMKPTAYLINTARGGLVCELDLVDALKAKRIAGAALDVFEEEPAPAHYPLFTFDNVLCTPHAAGVDLQSRDDMAMGAAKAIIALRKGEWPAEQIVNPEVRAKFRWS